MLSLTYALAVLSAWTEVRPYTIFYLAAVAAIAGGWGLRIGLFTALLAVLATDFWLLTHSRLPIIPDSAREGIELLGLIIGSVTVALIAGRLHDALHSLREAAAERQAAEARQEVFFREVVAAVTHNRLLIVDREEMQKRLAAPPAKDLRALPIAGTEDIGVVRHAVRDAARRLGFPPDRVAALELCVGEAVTNAFKHGGGGQAQLLPFGPADAGMTREPDGSGLRVFVVDRGGGMSTVLLPRLALWRGYSTQKSMGMGFTMMLDLADRVLLCTDREGTVVLIEMAAVSDPEESAEALLAAFPGLDELTPQPLQA